MYSNLSTQLYYYLKPVIPRYLQISVRRKINFWKRLEYFDVWPIDENACVPPDGWNGWPEKKQFALVLTHDVETYHGVKKCAELIKTEEALGFRSSFNFVAEKYIISSALHRYLRNNGFEIGVHGLYHDGKLYSSEKIFRKRAGVINKYLKSWKAVGFRSPSMHSNLEWIHDLDIEYDASTFDTDPFEPQSKGMKTIFPFLISNNLLNKRYIELPYTLPQDSTLFIFMKEKDISIWKMKLDWIVKHGGMALLTTHPDYMNFNGGRLGREEYSARHYVEFLKYIKDQYGGQYWHPLPKDLARFFKESLGAI